MSYRHTAIRSLANYYNFIRASGLIFIEILTNFTGYKAKITQYSYCIYRYKQIICIILVPYVQNHDKYQYVSWNIRLISHQSSIISALCFYRLIYINICMSMLVFVCISNNIRWANYDLVSFASHRCRWTWLRQYSFVCGYNYVFPVFRNGVYRY